MVSSIKLYVEGGGPTALTGTPFRQGFSTFLSPAVSLLRNKKIKWDVVVCGGRKEAYDAFVDAMENEPEVLNLLLVDAETCLPYPKPIVVDGEELDHDPWPHLAKRVGDGWVKPQNANSRSCHIMSACMEAWFVADPAGMKKHYTKNFAANKLPAATSAESTPKLKVYAAMKAATLNTPAGEYGKIRDGAKLLAKIDPAVVRKHCKWCERLFKALEDAVNE